MINLGATLDDLSALESGSIHRITSPDPDPAMYFRQVAFHRMLLTLDEDKNQHEAHTVNGCVNSDISMDIYEAGCKAVTQIKKNEIADDKKVFGVNRSGTRYWPMAPLQYGRSSIPVAMARLNRFLVPAKFHSDSNVLSDSNTLINDQIIIRVNKKSNMIESPTPEGVHQDGTEISSVSALGKSDITGGQSRIWPLATPTGPYEDDMFESSTGPYTKEKCLFDSLLSSKWDTIYFNDRMVKHEARSFDGKRPVHRDVIVNFVRKPLSNGKDMKFENGEMVSII